MKNTPRIVNVIELNDNVVMGIDTFVMPDNVAPHSKEEQDIVDIAEKLFARIAKENGMEDDDLEACLDDGYYELDTFKVVLQWSSENLEERVSGL